MKADRFQLDLRLLPRALQQELVDYYNYLLSKHRQKTDGKPKREKFFISVDQHRYSLPKNYQFDRDAANKR